MIAIYGEITPLLAESVRKQIENSKDEIVDVYINSPGGNVFAGLDIYRMLSRRNVSIHIEGMAGSIASVIALAGNSKPSISPTGSFMIHNPFTMVEGDYKQLSNMAKRLESYRDIIAEVYTSKTGMDRESIVSMMDDETVIKADDALLLGFASEVREDMVAVAYYKDFDMTVLEQIKNAISAPQNEATETSEAEDSPQVETFSEAQLSKIGEMITKAIGAVPIANMVGDEVAKILNKVISEDQAPQAPVGNAPVSFGTPDETSEGMKSFFETRTAILNNAKKEGIR